MKNTFDTLHEKKLIVPEQYDFLKKIEKKEIVSLFSELQLALYLGILLFTGGVSYLVYQNIGQIGHIISMGLLLIAVVGCFWKINKLATPFSTLKVELNHIYFDYLVLLAALLIIGLLTYVVVYFDLTNLISYMSLLSSIIMLYMAYRYDNKALLSMAITAFAAFVGIGLTPIDWVNGDIFESNNLIYRYIALGVILTVIGEVSNYKIIKSHFKFTYQNFGLLLLFIGLLWATFEDDGSLLFTIITIVLTAITTYYSWHRKEFLFFIYSTLTFYIAFTHLIFRILDSFNSNDAWIVLMYYFPASAIGFIALLINKKAHFSDRNSPNEIV